VTHLGDDGGLLAVDVDPGASRRVMARRGEVIREIARQLGCTRNTVRRYLREEGASRYELRSPRATKLARAGGAV